MKQNFSPLFFLLILFLFPGTTIFSEKKIQYKKDGEYRLVSKIHLLHDVSYRNGDLYNVVIEIPAGTRAKWEVNKTSGHLEWEFKKGKPRKVKYIPYPGNYGFFPQTSFDKSLGGDNDPLDVIVLGESVERGEIMQVRVIGALKLKDKGENDHKVIAVPAGEKEVFSSIKTVGDMKRKFPGVIEIIRFWFEGYKKPGEMQFTGFMEDKEAMQLVEISHSAWKKSLK